MFEVTIRQLNVGQPSIHNHKFAVKPHPAFNYKAIELGNLTDAQVKHNRNSFELILIKGD